jgi:hypothetical protein
MYEPFYGLKTKPFAIVPDPRFIYWAGSRSMAFAMLEYGIVNHAGFTVEHRRDRGREDDPDPPPPSASCPPTLSPGPDSQRF